VASCPQLDTPMPCAAERPAASQPRRHPSYAAVRLLGGGGEGGGLAGALGALGGVTLVTQELWVHATQAHVSLGLRLLDACRGRGRGHGQGSKS